MTERTDAAAEFVRTFHDGTTWGPDGGTVSDIAALPKSYPRFAAAQLSSTEQPGVLAGLSSRRSERDFADGPLGTSEVESLASSFRTRQTADGRLTRAVPSAGSLFSTEIYLLHRRVRGWHLDHVGLEGRELERLWSVSDAQAAAMFPAEVWVLRAGVVLIITGRLGAAVARYGIRGYRFVLLEAGAAGLAATLVAQEMQLASCMVGGFDDGAVLEVLDIDAAEAEVPLLAVAIGRRRSPGRA